MSFVFGQTKGADVLNGSTGLSLILQLVGDGWLTVYLPIYLLT